ncbi:TerC family protein [Stappia taiwanensis]|uniref:TerC family protein n=1 Tax=Stappia taiwanensis TaxID=992267 RepID=A0A838XX62_9HYPH|nr:TerC family protein [Stappia taiwanensis]MBA4613148.1 TerC family protein [Stappia taiwanensis]GGE80124.1 membrane protein [Stappia taiwanensis]
MMDLLGNPAVWASLFTLTVMEIVLGIDNIIFISVIVSRLEEKAAKRARQIGLALALIFRIALLSILTVLIGLTEPVFSLFGEAFSWRDLILLAGGLFLIVKGTHEIHQGIEGGHTEQSGAAAVGFGAVIAQIIVIDMVFSVDSIVTAIGMAQHVEVMVAAVVIAMIAMYIASGPISAFVQRHPTTKMLALAFLLLIGVALVADGLGFHIPRGYIYFAMAFSAGVEIINILASARRKAG